MNFMDETVFCIPSYKRHERQDTLEYLLSVGVPKENIYLFVQTEEDYKAYAEYAGKCNLIYRHATSLPNTRNNILEYFGGGKNIVMLDDDISTISAGSNTRELVEVNTSEQFTDLIDTMFELTRRMGGSLCGFYPVCNAFFMSDSVDTKKPVNTIIGFPKGVWLRFDERFVAKEDIELCGRVIASGGNIVRINNVSFKAKHRTNKGGANEIWKSGVNRKYARLLEEMYPSIYKVQGSNKEEVRCITKNSRRKSIGWKP